ncbi:TPA: hypothetical protein ACPXE8_001369 [Streptococcus pneumoniae]
MLELYFVYNGHCKFYLGTFDNVDDLIEQMEDHQWAFSAITHPRFQKHIGQRTTRFDYGLALANCVLVQRGLKMVQ